MAVETLRRHAARAFMDHEFAKRLEARAGRGIENLIETARLRINNDQSSAQRALLPSERKARGLIACPKSFYSRLASPFKRLPTSLGLPVLRAPATTPAKSPEIGNETPYGPSIRLSYAGPVQDLSGRQKSPGEHSAVLLSRRQDRRARRQRLGQIDASSDHGRDRHGIRRRGPC